MLIEETVIDKLKIRTSEKTIKKISVNARADLKD
jgi:hypothetical protein